MALNYAASFSGSNYLNVANYTGNPAALSVSCWIRPSASQTSRIFFSNYSGGPGWAVGISDSSLNQLKFYLGSNTLLGSGAIANTSWTHAVFTWDGTAAKIYLGGNATPNATLTSGVNYGSVPASNYIGSLNGSSQDFNGRLAGVGYWSKALSTAEIASLYNSGAGLSAADLSGSLLTSLGSYHDFADASSLGTDGSGNGRNYTNTGSAAQDYGPMPPFPTCSSRTQRPGRPVPQGRFAWGLVRAITFPNYGVSAFRNETNGAALAAAGTIAWGRNAWGPCLSPNDATGQGCVNMGAPIPAGATEFTLVATALLDIGSGGVNGNRHLWGAEAGTNDGRVVLNSGLLQFQVGGDGVFPNLTAEPPPLNRPVVITARLTAAGVRSIWYGPFKAAERTDAGAAWGSNGAALGLGSSAAIASRNWSGQINAGYAWTRALSDAEIVALAGDFFAPVRPARISPAIVGVANSQSTILAAAGITLGGMAAAASGTFLAPATAAITLAPLSAAATGSFATTASAGLTLGGLSAAGTGTFSAAATASVTLVPISASAAGTTLTVAAAGVTLGSMSAAATGTVATAGTAAIALGPTTPAAVGTFSDTAAAGVTLGPMAAVAPGTFATAGSSAVTLGPMAASAAGSSAALAAAGITLGPIAAAGIGSVVATAVGAPTMGPMAASAAGTFATAATSSIAMGPLAASAAGSSEVVASASIALGPLAASAAGFSLVVASASIALGPLAASAAGSSVALATAAIVLRPLAASGSGAATATASAAIHLARFIVFGADGLVASTTPFGLTDPFLAAVIADPPADPLKFLTDPSSARVLPAMIDRPLRLKSGSAFTRPIQCFEEGTGTLPAAYGATDILACVLVQRDVATPIFIPAVAWQTVDPATGYAQTGYAQGQVEVTATAAQAALLRRGNPYWIDVIRALASDPANTETIASIPLHIIP